MVGPSPAMRQTSSPFCVAAGSGRSEPGPKIPWDCDLDSLPTLDGYRAG
jgi:hypothetical protein